MDPESKEVCVGILTVSDSCASGEATDVSGQNLHKLLNEGIIPGAKVTASGCVSDDESSIIEALQHWVDDRSLNVILTTGGTGFSPRDVTPEAVKQVIEREAIGLTIQMITSSLKVTPLAALSRPVCGIRKNTIIATLPGSAKASEECLRFIAPVLQHAIDLLSGKKSRVAKTHKELQSEGVKIEHASHSYSCHAHKSHSHAKEESLACRPRKSPYPMISVADAQNIVMEFAFRKNAESLSLADALGFVLAVDVASPYFLPPFPASIKDGYAVVAEDGTGHRKVVGGISAGDDISEDSTPFVLKAKTCVRINTGAPVPSGADAVVQVEDTELVKASEDGSEELEIKIMKKPSVGQDIRPIGCDIMKNQVVLTKENFLGPAEIGILASVGAEKVEVYSKPVVGLLSTGNELQSVCTGKLTQGKIYDSNMPVLKSLLQMAGIPFICGGISLDNPTDLSEKISKLLLKDVDILVTTGSVSMGDRDILRQVLQKDFNATIHFAQVFMKPGKPTTFATFRHSGKTKLVLGLPGNPVSATVTANLYLLPLCRKMAGRKDPQCPVIKAKLSHSISLDPRPEYHRATLSFSPSTPLPLASSTGNQLSSRLLSCAQASALLVLPPRQKDRDCLPEGTVVDAMLLSNAG